jgi:preprotein translocase subunit YajC
MHPTLQAFLAQSSEGQQSPITALLPFVAIAVVFYFIFFRPQQKQQKQHRAFLEGLKKGDEVVTQSGIIGEVTVVEDRVVTINVGGGTKLRVLKAQVAGQWREGSQAEAKPEKK